MAFFRSAALELGRCPPEETPQPPQDHAPGEEKHHGQHNQDFGPADGLHEGQRQGVQLRVSLLPVPSPSASFSSGFGLAGCCSGWGWGSQGFSSGCASRNAATSAAFIGG